MPVPTPQTPLPDQNATAKQSLVRRINVNITDLNNTKNALKFEYPKETFTDLGKKFETIAAQYEQYKRSVRGEYHKLLKSSNNYRKNCFISN